jgi:hypothetical protein
MTVNTASTANIGSCSDKMNVVYFNNQFPHDDLHGLLRGLHMQSKDRRHPILAQFLDEATLAIRDEVRQLPATLRILVPTFETILTLADFTSLRQGPLGESTDHVLLCVLQLGTLIGYVNSTTYLTQTVDSKLT